MLYSSPKIHLFVATKGKIIGLVFLTNKTIISKNKEDCFLKGSLKKDSRK